MESEAEIERACPPIPRIRLAFSRLLVRLSLAFGLLAELLLWAEADRRAVPQGPPRMLIFLFYTPRFLFVAFLIAAGLTVLADLAVRLLVRPAVLRWHRPGADPESALFDLQPSESVLDSMPARRKVGRLWPAGSLIRTTQGVRFLPNAFDREPMRLAPDRGASAEAASAPPMFLNLVRGLPDLIRVRLPDGSLEVFAVPDPQALLAWFRDPPAIPAPGQEARRAQDQAHPTPSHQREFRSWRVSPRS